MKKIILSVMMVLSMCTVSSANEFKAFNRMNTAMSFSTGDDKRFDFDINYRQLSKYLCLNDSDKTYVIGVMDGFRNGMSLAGKAEDDSNKEKLILNSIDFTVRNMKGVLDKTQYSKFMRCFNLTLVNRGFKEEIALYGIRNSK